ncbi:NAD(P)/FAD-dependent oxidoreductase [Methanococcus maripaludis]|uniref:FAD-dependent oxidoreductase n=1 Tax=Methanococcus maripaludis TaxID=39152 RepID=UPI0031422F25
MIAVVGGGPAGLSCAHALAKRGLDVEIYEMDKLGGTCLNYGCRYVNALKEVADIIDNLNAITGKKHDLEDVISLDELHEKVYKIHKSMRENAKKTLEKKGIFVKFEEFKEDYEKNYDYVVYATGQNYAKNYLGVECATHKELPYLKKLPKKILIIGGGTVAAEYASIFSIFGSDVTVYARSKFLKKIKDDEVRDYIINDLSNFKITNNEEEMKKMLYNDEYFNILAIGGKKRYETNEYFQVSGKSKVYACGDSVRGGYTPIANREGRIVAENIFNEINNHPLKKMDYGVEVATIRMPINISVVGKQTNDFKTSYNRPGTGYYFKKAEKRGMNRIYYENGKAVGAVVMTNATELAPYFAQYLKGIEVYKDFVEVYPTTDPFYWQF